MSTAATAYVDHVRRHRALGFTDFSTVAPGPGQMATLRTIATEIIPGIREGRIAV